jgi:hypothetical protein
MDKIAPALIVAAISSLTFVAYKHPNAYKKLWLAIMVFYFAAFMSLIGWNAGCEAAFSALKEFIASDKLKEAIAALENKEISTWIILTGVGLYFYLFALTFLPLLLDEDKPK